MKRWTLVSAFVAVLSCVGVASASPNYPDIVQEVSGSSCAPTCLLCHSTNPGKLGSVITPGQGTLFAKTDVNTASLRPGLAAGLSDDDIRAVLITRRDGIPPTDVDGDGKNDFDELAEDVNPNPGNEELCEISYGCGARVAPPPPSNGLALFTAALTAVGLVGIGWRSRRRRR